MPVHLGWSRYPFNATNVTNLSPVCDMVAEKHHDFGGFGKDAYKKMVLTRFSR